MRALKHMCTILLAAALLAATGQAHGQRRESKLTFDAATHDFGAIAEADGSVVHVFTFTNTGSKPIVIEKVNSDCGCTVPKYDRKPIQPRGKGQVEVRMDPAGYSGDMRKCVTVISTDGRQQGYDLLCLTAKVTPRPRTLEEEYPLALAGGLRAVSLHAPFGYMPNNSSKTETIAIVNNSGKTVSLEASSETDTGLLKVRMPRTLAPGEKGSVTLTYDFTGPEKVYGIISDRVYISVDGKRSELSVNANVIAVDDFNSADPASVARARVSPVFHNFRSVKAGQALTKEFVISNAGSGPLIVRDVSARRNTVHDLKAGTVIEPGESTTVTVTMTLPRDAEGTVAGGITVIFNDPDRPMRDIRTVAEVAK